jgi:hypothetical protein
MVKDAFDQQHGVDVSSVGKWGIVCSAEIEALPTPAERPVRLICKARKDSLTRAKRVKEAVFPVGVE